MPQYEWEWIPALSRKLSETTTLFEIDFAKVNREDIHCLGKMKITQRGLLNGIRLSMRTYLTDDIVHDSSMGFCPRVVIPTKNAFAVDAEDEVSYELSYKAGHGYASFQLDIHKLSSKS